jgi:hypothetical protein
VFEANLIERCLMPVAEVWLQRKGSLAEPFYVVNFTKASLSKKIGLVIAHQPIE